MKITLLWEGGTFTNPLLLFRINLDDNIKFIISALNCLSKITEQMADKIMAGNFDFKNNCHFCVHSLEKHSEVEKFGYCPE